MCNTVSNRTQNLPCYNDKCAGVFPVTKSTGCPYSDTCPDFYAVGFGSAKKKTNFDHIKEMSVNEFVEMFKKTGCPKNADMHKCIFIKDCETCWENWLNSEYNN